MTGTYWLHLDLLLKKLLKLDNGLNLRKIYLTAVEML